MDVLQCPDCELKFRLAAELDQHLALEHPAFYARMKESGESAVEAAERFKAKRRKQSSGGSGPDV